MKKKEKDSVLERAKKRLKICIDNENQERKEKLEDLKFLNGEQWDSGVEAERKRDGRPMITVNKLPQFLKQVVNEQRQNSPQIKVLPAGGGSDPDTARIFGGLIKNIEAQSRASEAYDTGFYYAAATGEGYFRVVTQYSADDTFDQDIRIEKINNPFSVYLDPNHQRVDGSDAKYALITEMVPKEDFKERFGKEFEATELETGTGDEQVFWNEEEKVRVAEYWEISQSEKTLYLMQDGSTVSDENGKPEGFIRERKVLAPKVTQYILTGSEVIETNEWPGKYIPIIKVTGDELWIEGKRYTFGLIRFAKGPQQMYNYWRTAATELVALAPKAPWLVTPKQIENHQDQWDEANVRSYPYLLYNSDPAAPMPQRVGFANSPVGAVSEALQANDDMKQVTGINDASRGITSNETSGKAIMARKTQGDIANFNYIDNLSQSVSYCGRILVDLIPKIYDAERMVRINGPDGKQQLIPVNKEVMDPMTGVLTVLNDITVGEYDVEVSVGPNYATRRQENRDSMIEFLQYAPNVAPILAPMIAKNMDWEGADELAEQLKMMLPPELRGGQPQIPEELQKAMMEHQQLIQQQQQEIDKLKQDQTLKIAEFQQKKDLSEAEMILKTEEMNRQFELEVAQMQKKHELAMKELEMKMELKVQEMLLDAEVKKGLEEYKINTQAQVDLANGEKERENGVQEGKETEEKVGSGVTIVDSSVLGPISELAKAVSAPKNKVIEITGPSGRKYTGKVVEN